MPQMSPILWLNLFIVFTFTLIIFIAMFFYTKTPSTPPQTTKTLIKSSLNWKW